MKKIVSLMLISAVFFTQGAFAVGKIQREGVKTATDLTNAGSDISHLIGTDQIYDLQNTEQLSASISGGLLGGGGGGGVQYLANPEFEVGTAAVNWTITGAAGANELTTIYKGKHSEKLTYSSSTGSIAQSLVPSNNTSNLNMEASCKVLTTLSTIEVCGLVGGVKQNCQLVPATGTWQYVAANFVGPSNGGTMGVQVDTTTSTSGSVYVDDCYAGPARNLSQVNQAQLVGSITYSGSSCQWQSTTGQSLGPIGTATCTNTVSGLAQAPASGASSVPGIKFNSLPPGEYILQAEGFFAVGISNAGYNGSFQFSDGTNSARELSHVQNPAGSGAFGGFSGINQSINYTTSQSNVTLQIYASAVAGSATLIGNPDLAGQSALVIKVYYMPTQSQVVYRPDATPASWSGYQVNTGGWSVSNTSYSDLSSGSGVAITQTTNRNFGTVISEATGLPGITFNPPRTGIYHVCATPDFACTASSGCTSSVRMVDGLNNIIDPGHAQSQNNSGGTIQSQSTLCGNINVSSIAPVTVKMQGASDTATFRILNSGATGSASIQWSVIELDAPMPAPILVNSVVSGSVGVENIQRALLENGTICSSSPCIINSQSGGWLTSMTRSGAGIYTLNFSAGAFSSAPSCEIGQAQYLVVFTGTVTASSLTFETENAFGITADSGNFHIICMGPK